jgi:cytochrome c553
VNRWVKRLGIGVLGLVVVVGVAGAGVYSVSSRHFGKKYDLTVAAVAVPTDSASIASGARFASAITKCVDCHGANLQGQIMMNDPAFAVLAASNLTAGKGGVAKDYKTDADWVRAIRHGVRPDGRPLIIMPSEMYNELTDHDLGQIIAWVKSRPAQDNELPAPKVGPIARSLFTAGKLPVLSAEIIDHARPSTVIEPSVSVEYGEYLAVVGGCKGCHTANLAGGPSHEPGGIWPANLTPAGRLGKWSEADFFAALRTGKRPDGSNIDPSMPWALTSQMTDDEIRAVWLYLKTVPAVGGIIVTPAKS